jgi:hypothetical protein
MSETQDKILGALMELINLQNQTNTTLWGTSPDIERELVKKWASAWKDARDIVAKALDEKEKELMHQAFSDFEDDFLTDGSAYAPSDTYEACWTVFKAAWPHGAKVAYEEAKKVYMELHPPRPTYEELATKLKIANQTIVDLRWQIKG